MFVYLKQIWYGTSTRFNLSWSIILLALSASRLISRSSLNKRGAKSESLYAAYSDQRDYAADIEGKVFKIESTWTLTMDEGTFYPS